MTLRTGPRSPQVAQEAIAAVGRSILVVLWHEHSEPGTRLHDLVPDFYDALLGAQRATRKPILQALGHNVSLQPVA